MNQERELPECFLMFFAFFGEIRCLNSLLYQFICPNGCYTIGMNGICQKFSSCLFFHAGVTMQTVTMQTVIMQTVTMQTIKLSGERRDSTGRYYE